MLFHGSELFLRINYAETGYAKLMHWDNLEGWDGEGGGRRVQDGGHSAFQFPMVKRTSFLGVSS